MPSLQDWIHKLEEGGGARHLKTAAFCVAILFLMLVYNWFAYRNFATPEAMDSAQLARNLAEGRGYTTLFIRPFSLYLVQSHNQAKAADALASAGTDFAQIKTAHPDLANPPVYPLVLAGLMKVLPFHYPLDLKSAFWSSGGNFWRYEPDFLIALFNEVLLLVVVVLTFFLARKLFDTNVAKLSAILVLGCELLWRFSVSGLSTMLLIIIFFGLIWCILRLEEVARDPQASLGRLLGLAIAAGRGDRRRRAHAICFWLGDNSRGRFFNSLWRAAPGVVRAGGFRRLCAGVGALDYSQFHHQRHAVRNSRVCHRRRDRCVPRISTGTFH